ncbi:porin [Halobacteriovorax sp. RZ-1]|uniref:porin n=1 Tax=unclassified Halobacteriovorax TaxID=2639665 RepID=UPI003723AD42
MQLNKVRLEIILCSFLLSNTIFAIELADGFDLYGKISMAFVGKDGTQSLNNNSSRFGFKYKRDDLIEGFTTGFRAEFGINTSNTSQNVQGSSDPLNTGRFVVDNTSDKPFSSRLAYLWLSKGDFEATIGKNWSIWYDVTGFTDIFMITGAYTSSTYTANSEIIGTSRAVDVLDLRYKLGYFHFGAQYKLTGDVSTDYDSDGDGIDDANLTLENSTAASIRYLRENMIIGIAAIHLESNNNGNKVDKVSVSIGTKFIYKDFFLAAVYGDAKDLELIEGQFIETDNLEALVGWRLNKENQFMVGYNWQISSEIGYENYEIGKYLASYIYAYKTMEFGVEFVYDDSTAVDGGSLEDHEVFVGATLYF